jgi:glucose/arabinose dehydrogenase
VGTAGRRRLAKDGALLVTDDGSNSIWRVSYAAAPKR